MSPSYVRHGQKYTPPPIPATTQKKRDCLVAFLEQPRQSLFRTPYGCLPVLPACDSLVHVAVLVSTPRLASSYPTRFFFQNLPSPGLLIPCDLSGEQQPRCSLVLLVAFVNESKNYLVMCMGRAGKLLSLQFAYRTPPFYLAEQQLIE